MEKQLKESTQEVSTNNCTLPSRTDTGVKRSSYETGHFDFDVKMPRTETIPMDESGSGIFYDENKGCINNTSADVKSANKTVSFALFDDNGSTEIQDTLALFDDNGSTEVQDTFGSSNSKTIAEYIESDTNSSSAENIGFCINSEFDSSSRTTKLTVSKCNVSGLSLLASYNDDEDSEEDDDESDYRDDSSDDSSIRDDYLHRTDDSVMFHHPCKVDSLLDKTMAVLIRTRLKLEEFALTGELTYNCKPLVDLIEGCEHLYEHD
ncbi:hypothetical protein FSP39_009425 [Pinctada imbricata]|uniref:Uncharacterized protein n=1 Tax=Pinctada imbricata TaxID=66713 RepID=A0AA88YDM2_PINIB|nr:hypothetical protein FSP39_009425 [Pinctada imbricata]